MEGMMVSARFRNASSSASQAPFCRRCHSSTYPLPSVDRRAQPLQGQPSACGVLESASSSASIWHTITPSTASSAMGLPKGFRSVAAGEEGCWNTAWDVRPARWLHGSGSAWLLFGVRPSFAPVTDADESGIGCGAASLESQDDDVAFVGNHDDEGEAHEEECALHVPLEDQYRVTGVLADGRCLFRAIIYGACISSGMEAPDESAQGELADQLRQKVAEELLKRRDEMEWSVEGDFDAYIENIQQPWTWGGEVELLMASHVLQKPISVFMINKISGGLLNIANYGHDYEDRPSSIKVLFHGYGHYDALEILEDT